MTLDGIIDNLEAVICFILAKICGIIGLICGFIGQHNIGLGMFFLAFLLIFVCCFCCIKKMKFARNSYGEDVEETVEC